MEVAPTLFKVKPEIPDIHLLKSIKEYSKIENQKEMKILLGISNDSIIIQIKEDINTFNGKFNLDDLQVKDKYFRMFDTIDEAYKEFLISFDQSQYNIKIEENYLILKILIEHSNKKK